MMRTEAQVKTRSRVKAVERVAFGIDEIAAQLGVCDNFVRNEFHAGKLKGYRLGRRILISAAAFRSYLAEREALGDRGDETS